MRWPVSDWYRHKVDPLKFFDYFKLPRDHVTYDPKMRRAPYCLQFSSRHDSTLIFSYELFCNVVARLANIEDRITIGPLRVVSALGQVMLPCSDTRTYPGMRERVKLYFDFDDGRGPNGNKIQVKYRDPIIQPTWPSMFDKETTTGYDFPKPVSYSVSYDVLPNAQSPR